MKKLDKSIALGNLMSKPRLKSKKRSRKTIKQSKCYVQFEAEEKKELTNPEPVPRTKDLRAYRLAKAKRPARIVNLVLKGGGVLGSAYAGAFLELEQQQMYSGIQRVAGSSAGGLLAIFIAIGFTPEKINEIMLTLEFEQLLENPNASLPRQFWNYFSVSIAAYLPETISSYFAKNLDNGTALQNKLDGYIEQAITLHHEKAAKILGILPENFKNITFKQLQDIRKKEEEITGTSTIKELYLTGTNITINKHNKLPKGLTYFSHEHGHSKDMSIATAGRITSSHPFAYHSVLHEGHLFTDGAVADSCPVTFFDQEKYLSPEHKLDCNGQNPETLAMLVETERDIEKHKTPHRKDSWLHYMMDCLYYIFRSLAFKGLFDPKVDKVREDNHTRILQIHNCHVNELDFTIQEDKKRALIENGRLAMRRHIRNYFAEDNYLPHNHKGKLQSQYKAYKSFKLKYSKYNAEKIHHILKYELQPAIKRLKALPNQEIDPKAEYYSINRNKPIEKKKIKPNEYLNIIQHNLDLYRKERKAAKTKLFELEAFMPPRKKSIPMTP